MVSQCPVCQSSDITMIPFGTKALQLEIEKLFPHVAVKRFDTDSPKREHLSEHVTALENGQIQCIIGTQMVAKGLDLPKLKTLVVIEGSSGGGYMSEERRFQLLYQVMGRARRGHQDASIIIQTDDPESSVLKKVAARDYESFYESELRERKQFFYPPFCYMMIIHYSRRSSESAARAGNTLVQDIRSKFQGIAIALPLPNTTEKIRGDYNWHIMIKSPRRKTLQDIAQSIGTSWTCELDPITTP